MPDLGPRGEGWVLGQFALIGLLVVLSLPGLPRLRPTDPISWLGSVGGGTAFVIGGWLVARALADLGASLTPMPRPRPDARFVDSGVYARLRHPIYAGLIFASIGWSTLTRSLPALAVAILLAAFLDAKARREEAWLMERYDSYPAYRLRTKRFLPGIY